MTSGRGPAPRGGTRRRSGRELRWRKRPGESGESVEEFTDIGAIFRTEAILNSLAARRAAHRTPGAGAPGAGGSGAGLGAGEPGGRAYGAGVPKAEGVDPADAAGGDPALSVLAVLAADVDEHAGPRCRQDPWRDDACLRHARTVYGDSRPPATRAQRRAARCWLSAALGCATRWRWPPRLRYSSCPARPRRR